MENPPKVTEVTVTPEMVDRYSFDDNYGCALFHACKKAGIPVRRVTTSAIWAPKFRRVVPFFGYENYYRVRTTREPFTCLIIPEGE